MGFIFGIKFSPQDFIDRATMLNHDFRIVTDKLIKDYQSQMEYEVKKAAPGPAMTHKKGDLPLKYGPGVDKSKKLKPRTGRLRRGIKAQPPKLTKFGTIDRRADIRVESRSPHTRYVVGGARSHTGEGGKGTGMYFPGVNRRGRFGFWPGIKPYDFITKAQPKVQKRATDLTKGAVRTMEHRWRLRFRR